MPGMIPGDPLGVSGQHLRLGNNKLFMLKTRGEKLKKLYLCQGNQRNSNLTQPSPRKNSIGELNPWSENAFRVLKLDLEGS